MTTIRILEAEHRLIEQALCVFGLTVGKVNDLSSSDYVVLEKLLQFFRKLADQMHHEKEEHILFPAMVDAGVQLAGGPIGSMLSEHETGREQVACMKESVDGAKDRDPVSMILLQTHSSVYTNVLMHHIQHEDQFIYPMAERRLSSSAKRQIDVKTSHLENKRVVRIAKRNWTEEIQRYSDDINPKDQVDWFNQWPLREQ